VIDLGCFWLKPRKVNLCQNPGSGSVWFSALVDHSDLIPFTTPHNRSLCISAFCGGLQKAEFEHNVIRDGEAEFEAKPHPIPLCFAKRHGKITPFCLAVFFPWKNFPVPATIRIGIVRGPSERMRRPLMGSSTYRTLNCLWRLSECPDERTPHSLAISKTVLAGNLLGGEAASLHHQPCRFHAQPFDCLCGWLARFLSEQSAELPRAQKGGVRQRINRQRSAQMFFCVSERGLDAIGLRVQIQQWWELRLAAGTTVIQKKAKPDEPERVGTANAIKRFWSLRHSEPGPRRAEFIITLARDGTGKRKAASTWLRKEAQAAGYRSAKNGQWGSHTGNPGTGLRLLARAHRNLRMVQPGSGMRHKHPAQCPLRRHRLEPRQPPLWNGKSCRWAG